MDIHESVISRQEQTLNRVIEMVKYAESKNLALLTFNTAVIVILCQYSIFDLSKWYSLLLLSFWIISTVLAISSFIPIINSDRSTIYNDRNLVFFNTIGELSNEVYHDAVVNNVAINENYLKMINDQISINSRIATRKFTIFKHAIRFILIITVFLYFYEWYLKDKKSV